MISRRSWLAGLCAAPAASAARGYDPVFAGQPYVWTQYYAREKQSFTDHFADVLKSFSSAGYSTVELLPAFFDARFIERTVGLLRQYKLKAPVLYHGGVMHTREGADKTILTICELARRTKKASVALDAINFNPDPLPGKAPKSDAQLKAQAQGVNRLAAELKKQNVRLFIHQHDPEMKNGAREWRHILANTDEKLVRFCLDTHWVYRGGMDVQTLVRECAPRLGSLHLRNSKNGVWLEDFTAGDIDYPAIARFLKQEGFRGYLVVELAWDKETEITRPLESNLRRSLEYAKEVFKK